MTQPDFIAGPHGAEPARPFLTYENDAGEEIFPFSGKERSADYRRLAVLTEVQDAARKIWSFGPGPNGALPATVAYYCDHFRCRTHEVALAVQDWIAEYFPNGESTDLRAMTDADRRICAKACIDAAAAYEQRVRARLSGQPCGPIPRAAKIAAE